MNETTRQEIKDRIAAGEDASDEAGGRRNVTVGADGLPAAELSRERSGSHEDDDDIIGFIKDHPLTTIAGALAVGVLIAGLFPSARSAARSTGVRASALGVAGTQAALAALEQVFDGAERAGQKGGETIRDAGDTLGDNAREVRRQARYQADRQSDNARIAARDTGKAFSRTFGRFFR